MAEHLPLSPLRAAGLVVVAATAWASPALAQSFPSAVWAAFRCGGNPMTDALADEPDALGPRDLVGDRDDPAGQVAADDMFLYLRIRLDDSPLEPATTADLQAFGWGVAIDLDNDASDYELLLGADGTTDEVVVRRNTSVMVANSPRDPADAPPVKTYPFATHGRVITASGTQTGGDVDAHLELAFPWADLMPLGLTRETRAFVWVGSSSLPDRLDGDLACHDANGGGSDPTLGDTESDRDPIDPGPGPGTPDAGPGAPDARPGGGEGPRLEGGGGCSAGGGAAGWLLAAGIAGALTALRRRRSPSARTPA